MKNKMGKNMVILFLLFASTAYSQSSDWTVLRTVNNVTVSYRQDTCNNQSVFFFKMDNGNSQSANVSWSLIGVGAFRTIQLNAGETKSGVCGDSILGILIESVPDGKSPADLNALFDVSLN